MRYRIKQPSPGMLVVRPWQDEELSHGGIWIPSTAQREGSTVLGEVLAINPPPSDNPDDYFKVGDIVMIGKWSGTDFKIDPRGDKLILINEDSILATLEPIPNDSDSASTS